MEDNVALSEFVMPVDLFCATHGYMRQPLMGIKGRCT